MVSSKKVAGVLTSETRQTLLEHGMGGVVEDWDRIADLVQKFVGQDHAALLIEKVQAVMGGVPMVKKTEHEKEQKTMEKIKKRVAKVTKEKVPLEVRESQDAYQKRFHTTPTEAHKVYGEDVITDYLDTDYLPPKGTPVSKKAMAESIRKGREGTLDPMLSSYVSKRFRHTPRAHTAEGLRRDIADLVEKLKRIEAIQGECVHEWEADSVSVNQVECTHCGIKGEVKPVVPPAPVIDTSYLETETTFPAVVKDCVFVSREPAPCGHVLKVGKICKHGYKGEPGGWSGPSYLPATRKEWKATKKVAKKGKGRVSKP